MDLSTVGPWHFELNDNDHVFTSSREVADALDTCQGLESGRLILSYDDGRRPRWQRFLGFAPCYAAGFAALEWADVFASLIFLDGNWSEYRVLDAEQPVVPPDVILMKIARGEPVPCPVDECMDKARAFQGLHEALRTGVRPEWLSYRIIQ